MLPKILYLDDETSQLDFLKNGLSLYFELITFANAVDAIVYLKSENNKVDAIISDMHMPIINGVKFFELIKENHLSSIPFFFLSTDTSNEIKIVGLKKGAFDFLSPEMSFEEISVRIQNRLTDSKIKYKHISIDLKRLLVFSGKDILDLTQIEYKILFLLLQNNGNLITRDEIKNFAWPNIVVTDKTINSHLTNLRTKIERDDFKIISVKGKGIAVATVGVAC
jgi:DNA-binding response OmpR family regulator